MATLAELLADFGHAMLGRPLLLEANGVAKLGFYEGRELTLEAEQGSPKAYLHARVAALPSRPSAAFLAKLLTANLFGKATGDAWFAINGWDESIMLNRVLDTDRLDVEAFGEIVTGFMDAVEHWTRTLAEPDLDDEHEEDEEPLRAFALARRPGAEPLLIIHG